MPAQVVRLVDYQGGVSGGRRAGKTALAWHLLRQESAAAGLPIECIKCERPHQVPPQFGRCGCGSYAFGVKRPERAQPSLDFHAGEQ